ncbi:MAG TPA: cob(I)yrinic acid a,c-diamide adenosyltransferase [Thioalkalivibrio sp.]|nr:cob(I)yrinic acid a,c-diamide adenosyltransferase [Thioalkalivibrio sp.]
MGNRLSKIYTRTGDEGMTGLSTGERVRKDSLRIEAMGDVDELNSIVGMVLALELPAQVADCLVDVQHDLFNLGAEISMPGEQLLDPARIDWLEATLDSFNDELPPLVEFILPGGGLAAATCHLARSVCRRSERHLVALAAEEPVTTVARTYLNRLSDLLFVLARIISREAGEGEVFWQSARLDGNDA